MQIFLFGPNQQSNCYKQYIFNLFPSQQASVLTGKLPPHSFFPVSLSQPLSHCWIIPHTIAPVVHALPTLSARFPSQTFSANMLVLCFVVVSHPTKEIHLKNSSMSPEIHDSNWAQLVLISSLIKPHIKVILLQLHSLSAPLYSDTQAQSSKR